MYIRSYIISVFCSILITELLILYLLSLWTAMGPAKDWSTLSGQFHVNSSILQDTAGTPTKRQVSKRLKRQVYKTSNCKKTSIYILYLWLVDIRRFSCSHVCRQSDGCVLFSIWEGFLPYITIISKNDTLFTLHRNATLAFPILFV